MHGLREVLRGVSVSSQSLDTCVAHVQVTFSTVLNCLSPQRRPVCVETVLTMSNTLLLPVCRSNGKWATDVGRQRQGTTGAAVGAARFLLLYAPIMPWILVAR